MILRHSVTLLSLAVTSATAFLTSPPKSYNIRQTSLYSNLSPGDAVLLVGPGFLQLNIAKAAKAAGLRPVIVAPQKKIDNFAQFVNDADLIKDATIGIPDPGEPFYGELAGAVFCAEEAILSTAVVSQILDWKDQGIYSSGGVKRTIACVPITNKVNKEKSMGWIPIFNNDKKEDEVWSKFTSTFKNHPKMKDGPEGSIVRFGSLLGGSVDGADELQEVGLDECIYKMSLENYRDLKERSFDRYRLGAQILEGDAINVKPPNQENLEKEAIKNGEQLEAFRAVGGYPEQDRTNRHTLAQAVVQALMRPTDGSDGSVPKEFTVLSKCVSNLPTTQDFDGLFANPGASAWPDPFAFDPAKYGFDDK